MSEIRMSETSDMSEILHVVVVIPVPPDGQVNKCQHFFQLSGKGVAHPKKSVITGKWINRYWLFCFWFFFGLFGFF